MRRSTTIATALLATALLTAGVDHGPRAAASERAAEVRTEAFRLLNEGVAAYRRGEYALAVERLERSAGAALNSFRAYFYLGIALIGDRRYADAIGALDVALDLDPNHLQSLVARGDARLKLGDLDEARADYFRALKLRAEYAPALDGLARIFEAHSETDEAIAHYRRAIASDGGFAPAYTHLGDLFLRQDRFEEAVRLLEEAVEVRPDFGAGLNRLALAYGRLGLENDAVAAGRKAMELEPGVASHPAVLGTLQLEQGFVTTAERWFRRALELDALLPEARLGLAEVARRRGDYALALEELDTTLADPRIDALLRRRTEEIRQRLEAERDRVAELERRVGSGEAVPEELAELAALFAGRGRWDDAVDLQRRAPDEPPQRARLAYMLFRAGRYREAERMYAELAGTTADAAVEVNHGVSLALLGDDGAAVEAYRRALALAPDHRLARLYLGNSLLRLGRREPAVEAYRAFLEQDRRGESAERVRRILQQIAPEALPRPAPSPLEPVPEPPSEAAAGASP